MIKVENISVSGFEASLRGMRNPLNSWGKSDSVVCQWGCAGDECESYEKCKCYAQMHIGPKDMELMQNLCRGGAEHRKYLRMINVSMDITSNHIFWAEWDTYKVGVTRNSCSKMHKIHVKSFEPDNFSHEGIDAVGGKALTCFANTLETLEYLRIEFNNTKEEKYWRAMLELLPMGFNLKATVSFNYENVMNILHQRSTHKWYEWRELCDILRGLPYVKEIKGEE